MKTDPTLDRRKYFRVPSDRLVSIGRLNSKEALAHALDVSSGGIRFQCVELGVKPQELLKVTLTLGDNTLSVVGQAARVRSLDEFTQEVTLCFIKMDDELRDALGECLPEAEELDADERRAYSRLRLEAVVSVSRANLMDIVAQAQDVSLGGLRFLSDGIEMELGDVLRVSIQVDGKPVEATGQVVRLTELGDFQTEVAMAFLEVESDNLELLRQELSDF